MEDQVAAARFKFDGDGLSDPASGTCDHSDQGLNVAAHGSVRGFVWRGFVVELLPFDGLFHRFDTKHEQAILKDPNGAA